MPLYTHFIAIDVSKVKLDSLYQTTILFCLFPMTSLVLILFLNLLPILPIA